MDDPKIRSLLDTHYSAWMEQTVNVRSLGSAGGFSGARFWRIQTGDAVFALRRWPESAFGNIAKLCWSHDVLRHANKNGCRSIAVPLIASDGESLIHRDDALWQLEPWMPGKADFETDPNVDRLQNVLKALATFHQSVKDLDPDHGLSSSVSGRLDRLRHWYRDGRFTDSFRELQNNVAGHKTLDHPGETICRLFQLVAGSIQETLSRIGNSIVATQPVIGDIWHDHILLEGNTVTGIVDFGAMKMETIALDFGRLVGSLVGDDPVGWSTSIDAYRSICTLSEDEIVTARTLDQSGTVLAGLNWLSWICVENRQMGPNDVVFNRIQRLGLRMETMAQKL